MAEESEIRIYDGGAMSLIGPDAVELYQAATLRMSISLHQKCGMIPTRGVTITKMFAMVHRYSGKRYKRGAHDAALADLDVWIATMRASLPRCRRAEGLLKETSATCRFWLYLLARTG